MTSTSSPSENQNCNTWIVPHKTNVQSPTRTSLTKLSSSTDSSDSDFDSPPILSTSTEILPIAEDWQTIYLNLEERKMVLYSPKRHKLIVKDLPIICPMCLRPFDKQTPSVSPPVMGVDSGYFEMLEKLSQASIRSKPTIEVIPSPMSTSPREGRRSVQDSPRAESPLYSPNSISPPVTQSSSLWEEEFEKEEVEYQVQNKKSSKKKKKIDGLASQNVEEDQDYRDEEVLVDEIKNEKGEVNKKRKLSTGSLNVGYYKKFFREEIKLGRGGFGSVFKCRHVVENIVLGTYAIKKVPVGNNYPWLKKAMKEVGLLEKLHHPNIVSYRHSWLEETQLADIGPPVICLFILMDFYNGGNLESYIQKRKSYLSEIEIWNYFHEICLGLHVLHENEIVHNDLKPQNIMIHWVTDHHTNAKRARLLITDFGQSEMFTQLGRRERTGCTGTIEFMAPELLSKDPVTGEYLKFFDYKSDIWSLGIILYFLSYSKLPWTSNIDDYTSLVNEITTSQKIKYPEIPAERSQLLLRLMQSLLDFFPSRRPSTQQIFDEWSMMNPLGGRRGTHRLPELTSNLTSNDQLSLSSTLPTLSTPLSSSQSTPLSEEDLEILSQEPHIDSPLPLASMVKHLEDQNIQSSQTKKPEKIKRVEESDSITELQGSKSRSNSKQDTRIIPSGITYTPPPPQTPSSSSGSPYTRWRQLSHLYLLIAKLYISTELFLKVEYGVDSEFDLLSFSSKFWFYLFLVLSVGELVIITYTEYFLMLFLETNQKGTLSLDQKLLNSFHQRFNYVLVSILGWLFLEFFCLFSLSSFTRSNWNFILDFNFNSNDSFILAYLSVALYLINIGILLPLQISRTSHLDTSFSSTELRSYLQFEQE